MKIVVQTKTLKIRIYATEEQSKKFQDLTKAYRDAENFISQYIFDHDCDTNFYRVCKEVYYQIRGNFGLKAQISQACVKEVISRYSTVDTQLRQKPFHYRENGKTYKAKRDSSWLLKPLKFKRLAATLVINKDWSFTKGKISLLTMGKRELCDYDHRIVEKFLQEGYVLGSGKLVCHRKGKKLLWFLHIAVMREIPDFDRKNPSAVVGIDQGLRFLITTYDGKKTTFVSGKPIAKKRAHYAKLRARLQAKGTKSAKRLLKKLAGRETRWMTDVNHQLSKALVTKYGANAVFVLEDLTGVSFDESNLKRTKDGKRELRSWTFYQFEQFLQYKAEAVGAKFLKVSAKYTSQRCPYCGKIDKAQRDHDHHEYRCTCGCRMNDDRVAAINLQELGRRYISGEDDPKIIKE